MKFCFDELDAKNRYKLLTALVVPRPIAWVSTRSADGCINLAPYSFFNVMGHDPALVALGILAHTDKLLKDTARNIEDNGEFVINLVTEPVATTMNMTATDLPFGISEAHEAGLELIGCDRVKVPRIAVSSASLECRLLQSIPVSDRQRVILGTVLAVHVADDLVVDRASCHVDVGRHAPIGRMGGAGIYCRSVDRFELDRPDRATQP